MHKLPESVQNSFTYTGTHRLNNIVFVEGLSYEFNFYRVDD